MATRSALGSSSNRLTQMPASLVGAGIRVPARGRGRGRGRPAGATQKRSTFVRGAFATMRGHQLQYTTKSQKSQIQHAEKFFPFGLDKCRWSCVYWKHKGEIGSPENERHYQ
jgi:hypothetical protein